MIEHAKRPFGTRIQQGTADSYLLDYIANGGFDRVFLVSGKKSFKWFLDRDFVKALKEGAEVMQWSNFSPNPRYEHLLNGLKKAQSFAPDLVLGVGGGSVLDMSKLVAGLIDKEGQPIQETFWAKRERRKASLVLVPTTAGSGAEATHFSVLYKDGVKHSISGPTLAPEKIVLDVALIQSGTKPQKAASGLDALCQCIESIWAKGKTPESLIYAVNGLKLVSENLIGFVKGDDSKAPAMQWGAHLSGHAINISKTTAPHALSYYLTNELQVPHGIAVASTIGYFIDFHNRPVDRNHSATIRSLNESMAIINKVLGLSGRDAGVAYFQEIFRELELEPIEYYWPKQHEKWDEWFTSVNLERFSNQPIGPDPEAWLADFASIFFAVRDKPKSS